MPPAVNIVDPATGKTYGVDEAEAARLEGEGWTREGAEAKVDRLVAERREDEYGGAIGKVTAAGASALGTATGGISDVVFDALGEGDEFRASREVNPGASTFGSIAGAFIPVGVPGLAGRAGAAVGHAAEGASVLTKLGRAAGGAAVEGAILGAGSGVSEIALAKDPVTIDQMVSTIGSHALFGGAVGGVVGAAAKGVGLGLSRAKGALDDAARASSVSDDLARLDMKGLRAAEKSELEALEAARVPQRKELADEITALRRDLKDQKHFLTTKDVKLPAVEGKLSPAEIGRKAAKAQKQLDNILDNPKGFASNPEKALDALQRQEDAYVRLLDRADELRTVFRADKSGERLAALETIAPALERNRSLQEKVLALKSPAASERLAAITNAKDALAAGGGKKSLVEDMLGGSIMGHVAGAVSGLPIVGPMLGAKVARLATDAVFGKLGGATASLQQRGAKAIGTLLEVGGKVARPAPVLASKVLSEVRYGASTSDDTDEKPRKKKSKAPSAKLASSFDARTGELKGMMQYDANGNVVMRQDAREKLAAQLAGVRAVDPILADRMETGLVRRYEYAASVIPRQPDVAALRVGPQTPWRASDMEMRTWARIAHALEDPMGVVERLGAGMVTPEEAKAFRAVYPDMFRDIQQQIWAQLPLLQKTLPYQKRLALSIFSGMPVDPALDPSILSVLQAQYSQEPGTEGGTQAPTPQPQFGSVKADSGTPAQQREEGTA